MSNFAQNQYLLRKKVFKFVGASFKIFDNTGNLCFFVNQKGFKLREEIKVFSDESMSDELLMIKARKIIDFSSSYDVYDSKTGVKLGALRRKGLKSMIQDEWIIFNESDIEIGSITEDNMTLALIRRFLTSLIPQTFNGFINGTKVFTFKQYFNPFILKMSLDFTEDHSGLLDRRVGIAAAILLGAIEGRQN